MTRLDRRFLEDHASYTQDGVEERGQILNVHGTRAFGLLYRPAEPREPGFVVCHAYGLEFLTLRRIERAVARTLASLGHPVLAFHHRGYGDSEGQLEDATLDSHIEDVLAAADRLTSETGCGRLGLVGARLGGLVACAVARLGSTERVLLMNPVLVGRTYATELIREMLVVELALSDGRDRVSVQNRVASLERTGSLDALGYPIYWRLFSGLSALDLTEDVGAFAGDALVLNVSKAGRVPRPVSAFADRLSAQGGRCRIEVVQEPIGTRFGGPPFTSDGDPTVRIDKQVPIVDELRRVAREWMVE